MIATIGFAVLLYFDIMIVHFLIPNHYLKHRDLSEFEKYWSLTQQDNQVKYHENFNFVAQIDELIVCEETESLIYEDFITFLLALLGKSVITYTGSSNKLHIYDQETIALQANKFKYFKNWQESLKERGKFLIDEELDLSDPKILL
jgi:hypothetical protein